VRPRISQSPQGPTGHFDILDSQDTEVVEPASVVPESPRAHKGQLVILTFWILRQDKSFFTKQPAFCI
jgi:hypothetical protein